MFFWAPAASAASVSQDELRMPLLDELLDLLDPSGREWNETFIGLVLLGKIYRKPWFLPSNIGLQCDFHGNLREWREWKCNYLMPM